MMLARCPDAEEGARAQLRRLYFAYVNLLEIGRDRIISAGGSCDPVDLMESGDPALARVRAFFANVETCQPPPAAAEAVLIAAFAEIERLRLATSEASLQRRAHRIWEIACEMQGRPIPGAVRFADTVDREGRAS